MVKSRVTKCIETTEVRCDGGVLHLNLAIACRGRPRSCAAGLHVNPEMVKERLSASDTDAKGYLVRPDKTREAHDKTLVPDDLGLQHG